MSHEGRRERWARALAVVAEALGWYIALRAAGAVVERDALVPLREDLRLLGRGAGDASGAAVDPTALARALRAVDAALDVAPGGPSLPVVLLTAAAASLLGWWLVRSRLPAPWRAAVALAVSLPLLQLAVHAGITGDPWVWQGGGLEEIRGRGGDPVTVAAFLADPDVGRVTGNSATVTVVGLFALWVRFLLAGRGAVTPQGALRSFTIGFLGAVVGGLLAIAAGAPGVAAWALPQFALAAAALAVAHAARVERQAREGGQAPAGRGGGAPWAWSLTATLAALLAVALVFAAVALLDLQRLLEPPVAVAGAAVEAVLLVVVRPVFWVVDGVLGFVIDRLSGDVTPPTAPPPEDGAAADATEAARRSLPDPVVRLAGVAALTAGAWLAYRLAERALRGRPGRRRAPPPEQRAAEAGTVGTAALLRRLMRRPPRPAAADRRWLATHEAYRLFARAAAAARARGCAPAAGETPLRYTARAARTFDAPFLAEVGVQFDGARYGRRRADAAVLGELARALGAWERATPVAPPAPGRHGGAGAGGGGAGGAGAEPA